MIDLIQNISKLNLMRKNKRRKTLTARFQKLQ